MDKNLAFNNDSGWELRYLVINKSKDENSAQRKICRMYYILMALPRDKGSLLLKERLLSLFPIQPNLPIIQATVA